MSKYKIEPDEKIRTVEGILNGNDSLLSICQKYGIRAKSKLQDWIKKYNFKRLRGIFITEK